MVSIWEQSVIVAVIYLSVVLATLLTARLFYNKLWNKNSATKAAGLVVALLLVATAVSGYFLINTSPPNYTNPFTYSYIPLHVNNLKRADQLHLMLTQSGMRDPLGYIFSDFPSNYSADRTIQVTPDSPYYRLKYKNLSVPSLIQVPLGWLQNFTLLKVKTEQFLQVPPENASRVKVYVYTNMTIFRNSVNMQIRVSDSNSSDVTYLFFAYSTQDGFAETNIVYSTNYYSQYNASKIYAEAAYVVSPQNTIETSSLILTFAFGVTTFLALLMLLTIYKNPEGVKNEMEW